MTFLTALSIFIMSIAILIIVVRIIMVMILPLVNSAKADMIGSLIVKPLLITTICVLWLFFGN